MPWRCSIGVMAIGDDSYQLDALGNQVLIGLSAEETEEFLRLDAVINESAPLLQNSMETWYGPRERRWLELYERHETARRPFLKSSKTMH
jgi:hypothetical protein